MHEYVYADRILQSIIDFMKKEGKEQVSLVHVKVGELLDLSSESLNLAYRNLSSDTIASGSKLRVTIERSAVSCRKCGFEGRLSVHGSHTIDPAYACPRCGSPLRISKGNSVEIVKVE
ncbi:MAG: hydrogenase maturation nickel metallochaperone HypA [Nitrososphaerota archaeon]|jgi:hydrogenase nickel insertion protein HypA|nr:hydrogenase maturation nickel metallochaperone HypA [Nitrososphaerota archaeon]